MGKLAKLKTLFKDEVVTHTTIVFIGTALIGVFDLAYRLISVRLLSPQDYGAFNALISFVAFSSTAISPLGATLTRFFTEYITKKDFSALIVTFGKLIKILLILSFFIFVGFMFSAYPLARFLKTQSVHIVICGGIMALSLFPPLFTSLFQSFQKFKLYSFVCIVSSFGKLVIGVSFMFIGLKVIGALMGFFVAPIFIILSAFLFIPALVEKYEKHMDVKKNVTVTLVPIYKYFLPASLVMLSFTILTNIDVVLVKHFFSPLEAGYYSIAQTIGKIALFLPSALAIVIFPKSTKAHVSNSSSLKFLYKSLFLAAVCSLIFTAIAFLFPEFVLNIFTGNVNPISISIVGLFALAMSFHALNWITIHFLLATHKLKVAIPLLLIAALEIAAIWAWHSTLKVVLYIFFIFSVASFAISFFSAKFNKKA